MIKIICGHGPSLNLLSYRYPTNLLDAKDETIPVVSDNCTHFLDKMGYCTMCMASIHYGEKRAKNKALATQTWDRTRSSTPRVDGWV